MFFLLLTITFLGEPRKLDGYLVEYNQPDPYYFRMVDDIFLAKYYRKENTEESGRHSGKVLDNAVIGYDPRTGVEIFRIDFDSEVFIVSFGYFKSHDLIAICLDNPITRKAEIQLFNRNGLFQGNVFSDELASIQRGKTYSDPYNLYIGQITEAGNKTYFNLWDWPFQNKTNPEVMHEVELKSVGTNYRIDLVGTSFSKIGSISQKYQQNFHQRWLVTLDNRHVGVVDEADFRASIYNLSVKGYQKIDSHTLSLNNREQIQDWYKDHEDVKHWAASFSRVVGMYKIGQRVLLAYTVPYQRHRQISNNGSNNVLMKSEPMTVLYVQTLDTDLERMDTPPKVFENAFTIGVHDQEFYYLEKQNGSYYLKSEAIDYFTDDTL